MTIGHRKKVSRWQRWRDIADTLSDMGIIPPSYVPTKAERAKIEKGSA
jgi:hypothetical protein